MRIPFRNIVCATLLLTTWGTVLAFGQNAPVGKCGDTFESKGTGNSSTVKGAANQATDLALMGADALCPAECPATLVKIVSIASEQIITLVKEGGLPPQQIITFRAMFTGQYMCKAK